MIRRDTLTEYARGSLWVMPAFAVVASLAAGVVAVAGHRRGALPAGVPGHSR